MTQGVARYHDDTTTRDLRVSQTNPMPTANRLATGTTTSALQSKPIPGSGYLASCAANTNATLVSSASRDLHRVFGYNAAATVRYIKFYNKATIPTVGTDTPAATLACAPTAAFQFDMGGMAFASGIGYGITTGAAINDTTAPTAADIVGLQVITGTPG